MLKRGKDLKAIYKNEEFYAAIREGLVNIVSYDERTEEEGFEETNRGYWIKRIKIEDEDLEELSEFIFYVRYKERIIENEIWEVTYGTGLEIDTSRGIVVISSNLYNFPKNNTWKIYDKGLAKRISLKDCTEYMIKTIYSKKEGKVVDKLEETISVSEEELKKAMLARRRRRQPFRTASQINKRVKKELLSKIKEPHLISYPVIYLDGDEYYLAVFITLYKEGELKEGYLGRPTKWSFFDIDSGVLDKISYKIGELEVLDTNKKEFSSGLYNMKYNIKSDEEYDRSKEYYEEAFKILDRCKESIINEGKIDLAEYRKYLAKILKNVPENYRRFYLELSI